MCVLLFHDDIESVGTTTLLLPEQQVIPPDEPQRRRSHRLCLVLGSCVEGGSGKEGVGEAEGEMGGRLVGRKEQGSEEGKSKGVRKEALFAESIYITLEHTW